MTSPGGFSQTKLRYSLRMMSQSFSERRATSRWISAWRWSIAVRCFWASGLWNSVGGAASHGPPACSRLKGQSMRSLLLRGLIWMLAIAFGMSIVPPTVAARLVDRDRDGFADFVRVEGDYNSDGRLDADDIQDAINDLTDNDSGRTVELEPFLYGPPLAEDYQGLIVLPSNTELRCRGAQIVGYDEVVLSAKLYGTRIITTSSVVNPLNRVRPGSGLPVENVAIYGCQIRYDLPAAYDVTSWAQLNHFGIYTDKVTNLTVSGNSVSDTIHACAYFRSTTGGYAAANSFGRNCGNSSNTSSTVRFRQQALYLFASDGIDTNGFVIDRNVSLDAGSSNFTTRAEHVCVGGDDPTSRTNCVLGGVPCAGGGFCAPAAVKNVTFSNNVAKAGRRSCFNLNGLRDATVVGNTCDGQGISDHGIYSIGVSTGGLCSDENPHQNASCRVILTANTITNVTSRGISLTTGWEDTLITATHVSNTGSNGFRINGNFRDLKITNSFFENIGTAAGDDAIVLGGRQPAKGFEVSGITVDGVPTNGSLVEVGTAVDGLVLNNITGRNMSGRQPALRVTATPIAAYVNDIQVDGGVPTITATEKIFESLVLGSHIITNQDPPADTGGVVCPSGVRWTNAESGGPGSDQQCVNGVLVDLGAAGSGSFSDVGTAVVPPIAHDVIVGGDGDQACEAGEVCLKEAGTVVADAFETRDRAVEPGNVPPAIRQRHRVREGSDLCELRNGRPVHDSRS